MTFRILVAGIFGFLLAGGPARGSDAGAATREIHPARGIVREIAPDRTTALIRHDAIPDYMPAMTMRFNVRDTNGLSGVAVGDTIAFRLVTTGDTHWIDQIRKIASGTARPPAPAQAATPPGIIELKPGDLVPDCVLIAEDGRRVHLSDFRGKVLAFTFFFTRCPMPDFCPRMGSNFAKARELMLAANNGQTNWQFLSISFDPGFDKPAVLAGYGGVYRNGNPDRWLFAAAPAATLDVLAPILDLVVSHEADGSFSHNLRTVVLNPQGRIHRQFNGNQWTPQELVQSILEAASPPKDL